MSMSKDGINRLIQAMAEQAKEERNEAIATAAGIGMAAIVVILGIYYLGVYMGRW